MLTQFTEACMRHKGEMSFTLLPPCEGNHSSPVDSPNKWPECEDLTFSLLLPEQALGKKQSSCWWFNMPYIWCDLTVIHIYQGPLLLTQNSWNITVFRAWITDYIYMTRLFSSMSWGPFYKHGITLIIAWINSCYIHHKMWDKIIYPFQYFNGTAVKVWGWIPHFIQTLQDMSLVIYTGI